MAKFYNADTLLEFVKNNTPHMDGNTTMQCVEWSIKEAPTADVREVKRGHWKKSQFSGRSGFYSVRDVICSECGIYSTFLQHEIRPDYYCPNCGAEMVGEK